MTNENLSETIPKVLLDIGDGFDAEDELILVAESTAFAAEDVGQFFRTFDSKGSAFDFEVMEFTDEFNLVVKAISDVPEECRTFTPGADIQLYRTFTTVENLEHLEGISVSLMVDGAVISSPNNNIEQFVETVVESGAISLPDGVRGAFIIVGRPFTSDAGTLSIDKTTDGTDTIESSLVNTVYVSYYRSRGVYAGTEFPDDNKVEGMNTADPRSETDPFNAALALNYRREAVTVSGSWEQNGKVCLRQVDPLPMEVLAITPDAESPSY